MVKARPFLVETACSMDRAEKPPFIFFRTMLRQGLPRDAKKRWPSAKFVAIRAAAGCWHGARRALANRPRNDLEFEQIRDGHGGPSRLLDKLELTFFGTSSGAPTPTRNQQSVGLRLGGETWLFDCGEATQHRMMRTHVTPPSVRRIFISHLHGDHIFGLPGLLCNLAAGTSEGSGDTVVQIVGPLGLRTWLRAVLGNSYVL